MRLTLLAMCLVALFACDARSARKLLIKPDGSGDHPTIQAGVDAAWSGDTLLLATGTFSGPGNHDILIDGKSLVVMSVAGRDSTTLYCRDHRGFELLNIGPVPFRIHGVTILDASLGNSGAETIGEGLYVSNCNLEITNSAIRGCGGDWTMSGAGMAFFNSDVWMTSTVMEQNFAPFGGGGHILASSGTLRIDDCQFYRGSTHYADAGGGGGLLLGGLTETLITNSYFFHNNTSAQCCGGAIASYGSLVIRDCLFEDNYSDGGAVIFGAVDSLLNSVFQDNTTGWGYRGTVLLGDAEYVSGNLFVQNHAADGLQPRSIFEGTIGSFENNIVAHSGWYMNVLTGSADHVVNNTFFLEGSPEDVDSRFILSDTTTFRNNIFYDMVPGSEMFDGVAPAEVECSDIYVPAGSLGPTFVDQGGNIQADPLFCDASWDSDFSLRNTSPCIPESSPCGTLIGARNPACIDCPPDTTLAPGARVRMEFYVLNHNETIENCAYLVQCAPGLQLMDDAAPGAFASSIGGSRTLAAHGVAKIPIWVSVDETLPPIDSLWVSMTQHLLGPPLTSDTCMTTVHVSGAPVGAALPSAQPTLRQNWPNPFNPSTAIAFTVPARSLPATLVIYDVAGRVIRNLGAFLPGQHTAHWNGRDNLGAPVASGVYLCRLHGTGFALTRKIVLLR